MAKPTRHWSREGEGDLRGERPNGNKIGHWWCQQREEEGISPTECVRDNRWWRSKKEKRCTRVRGRAEALYSVGGSSAHHSFCCESPADQDYGRKVPARNEPFSVLQHLPPLRAVCLCWGGGDAGRAGCLRSRSPAVAAPSATTAAGPCRVDLQTGQYRTLALGSGRCLWSGRFSTRWSAGRA